MNALIVYESMFGNTRAIAEAIAEGMRALADVKVVGVADADARTVGDADLVVVGGPTHARSMSRPSTRKGASGYVEKPGSDLVLEPGADTGPGVREWLAALGPVHADGAVFDTRSRGPSALTGRASRGIGRRLSKVGFRVVTRPQSFLVTKNHLVAGETDRACAWGSRLATMVENPWVRSSSVGGDQEG